jgi:hypothetical protein
MQGPLLNLFMLCGAADVPNKLLLPITAISSLHICKVAYLNALLLPGWQVSIDCKVPTFATAMLGIQPAASNQRVSLRSHLKTSQTALHRCLGGPKAL